MDAWQVSAVSEIKETEERGQILSNVFRGYQSIIFGRQFTNSIFKICTIILVSGDYYESWRYIPFLMLATIIYNCMVQFMGSVYMIERKG